MEQIYTHEQIEAINLCKEMIKYRDIVADTLDACDVIGEQNIAREMESYHHGILHGVHWCLRLVKRIYNLSNEDI